MHARSGGNLEVMGMMQGKVIGSTMIVTDAFALPVEGTVNTFQLVQQFFSDFLFVAFAGNACECGR